LVELSLGLLLGGLLVTAGGAICVYWYLYWEGNFQGELLTDGPYSVVRHPYYSGFILLVLGLALALPILETRLLAVMTLAVISVYIPREEQELLIQYKKKYRRYMKKVKYKLIPGIY
jgi:protein-S-isoprenylcysteine O-methyltransferase Ste14